MSTIFSEYGKLTRSLAYHLKRHSLLTANVTNAETPGFRPLDIRFEEALSTATSVQRTNAAHLSADGVPGENRYVPFDASVTTAGPSGNSVSLEREMTKLAANSLRYRAATTMLSRRLGLLKYAASDGQRR